MNIFTLYTRMSILSRNCCKIFLDFLRIAKWEEFGIKQPNYQQWESGKRRPSSETLEKFANFFGVTMDYLAGNDEDLDNVELLFRMNSKGLTEEEREIFKKELIEFMEERKKAFGK